jgi:hypothetical protein
MTSYKCNFCNFDLSTNYSLLRHQKNNKNCIKIQKTFNVSENILDNTQDNLNTDFVCEFCNKEFKTKQSKNTHMNMKSCKLQQNYLENEKLKIIEDQKNEIQDQKIEIQNLLSKIEDLQKQNDEFQNTMKEIAIKYVSTPKIVNNKYTFLSTFNLTKDEIKNTIQKNFTENHFLNGQEGVAEFTYNNLLIDKDNNKLKYYCNDPSRKVFTYIDESGNAVKDIKSKNLTKMIASDVIDKSKSIMTKAINKTKNETEKLNKNVFYGEKFLNISNITSDNNNFVNALSLLASNKEIKGDDDNDDIIYYTDEDDEEEETEEQKRLRFEYEKTIYTEEYFNKQEQRIRNEIDPISPFYEQFMNVLNENRKKYLIL